MRGIGRTLSRLPAAPTRSFRAFIAGAAILAGAATSALPIPARGQTTGGGGDETAMAVPRIGPTDGGRVSLPQPLSPADAARIRRIFAMQARHDFALAEAETGHLGDKLLLGTILGNRYLMPGYRTSIDELRTWLASYGDQPDAVAVRALLVRKLPRGSAVPALPAFMTEAARPPAHPLPEDVDAPDPAVRRSPGIAAAEQARMLFARNRDAEALARAGAAFRRLPPRRAVGLAAYVAGLSAWRLGRFDLALTYFEAAARAPVTAPSTRAAAAFWAARASQQGGGADAWTPWMRRAAAERRTFYGMLARRSLGLAAAPKTDNEVLGQADVDAIGALPGGARAFALLQVGQTAPAEAELRLLWPQLRGRPGMVRSLLLVAREAGFVDLAADLAATPDAGDGRPAEDADAYVPHLAPRGGFRIDPALVYAVARLESNFDPRVISGAGARGLMQLMPVTAGYIGRDPSLAGSGRVRLHDPALNLDIGQRYLKFLAEQDDIDGNLLRVLASYNSGTGSFARWSADVRDQGDPLLFIEAIPNHETRSFVQHVLAYSWIYAARLHLPSPSLDALVAGRFPRFPAAVPQWPPARPAPATQQVSVRLH